MRNNRARTAPRCRRKDAMSRSVRLLALLGAAALLAGCASAAPAPAAPAASESAVSSDDLSGTVEVYAAASLQRSFDEIVTAFEREHPGVTVSAVYDGSSTLA